MACLKSLITIIQSTTCCLDTPGRPPPAWRWSSKRHCRNTRPPGLYTGPRRALPHLAANVPCRSPVFFRNLVSNNYASIHLQWVNPTTTFHLPITVDAHASGIALRGRLRFESSLRFGSGSKRATASTPGPSDREQQCKMDTSHLLFFRRDLVLLKSSKSFYASQIKASSNDCRRLD